MILGVHPLLQSLAPELVLVVGAVLVLLIGLSKREKVADSVFPTVLSTLAVAGFAVYKLRGSQPDTDAMLLGDSLVSFTRLCVLGVGLLIFLVNRHVPERGERGEFFALTLCALAGIVMVAAANDLVLLFLSLELVSVPTYVLIGLSRRDIRAQESTGKYFFLGAFAAALTLYGFSFLYGAAGTTQLFSAADSTQSIAGTIKMDLDSPLVVIGLLLSIGGLAFKIAAVPLHFYVADVYQGAASPVTGMLGFVPKLAGLIALIRLLSASGWASSDALFWLLWVMAALTMIVGNTLALWQQNVKRMLAYSSVAHTGYMLVGITAGPALVTADRAPLRDGAAATLFYMIVYGVMNLGAFAVLSFFRKSGPDGEDSVETLDELAGAARRHRWASLALAICVLGLMGFPLTGGFFGKFYLFTSALSVSTGTFRQSAMVTLVVIAVLNSAIAAAYYLRIVASCYLRKPADGVRASPCRALKVSIAACALVVLAVFLRPSVLFDRARDAMKHAETARVMTVDADDSPSAVQ